MPNDSKNVAVGKPKIAGAIYAAPAGTTVPTDATTELSAAFKCLGYVSEDGLTNSDKKTFQKIKAWGGDTVNEFVTEHTDTMKFKLIECLNVDVIKFVYGADNVSGSLESGLTIKSNAKDNERVVLVAETILAGNAIKRMVVPDGKVTDVADIVYKDTDAIAYETTLSAYPDASGNTHYEYISKQATGVSQED